MCELLDRVEKGDRKGLQEGRREGVDATRVENIRNIMKKHKYTAQQAMDLLEIPAADQAKYLAKL